MFKARFNSACADCPDMIREGQMAMYNAADEVVHVTCPETRDVDEPRDVCPRCFLELPLTGVCEDCS